MTTEMIKSMLLVSGFVFIVFLLSREFVCWYFKLSKIVKLLEEIKEKK